MEITIKSATENDAEIVAWVVFAALDEYGEVPQKMRQVCSEADTLYSWDKTRLIFVDGNPVGGLISYRGEDYKRLRAKTWGRCWDENPKILEAIERETFPGEYYLDSMALFPEYRRLGLGKQLIRDAMQIARGTGCEHATLLASKEKSGLVAYYQSIGFEEYGSMIYFGHDYWKMRIAL